MTVACRSSLPLLLVDRSVVLGPVTSLESLPRASFHLSPPPLSHFALVEDETVRFGPGFNVITGDSGAGKSILVQAVGMVSGGGGCE